jgi:ATP-dependent DNA ligase
MRTNLYLGPKEYIKPIHLDRFENKGYVAEVKHDGAWCCVETDSEGYLKSFTSRTGKTFGVDDCFSNIKINLPNSILTGELEVASQAATKNFNKLGYRRLFIFDAVNMLGNDIKKMPYINRRKLLEHVFSGSNGFVIDKRNSPSACISLVEKRESGFKKFFDEVVAGGGEGLVLKKKDSLYYTHISDGKTESWLRSKNTNTIDFYVMGSGLTPSRAVNLELGLYRNGRIEYIQSVAVPKGYVAKDLLGKVIECEGLEIMDSGALRSGHFARVREDKTMEMCC